MVSPDKHFANGVDLQANEPHTAQGEVTSLNFQIFRLIKTSPLILVAAIAACIFAIRMMAPPNLLDQDQERPASYVLDVIKNGNWLCQRDWTGDITSKPPLYTWLCAIATQPFGRINLFALYLPGALAGFGIAWLLFHFGRVSFGARSALFGALMSMLTSAGFKEFGLARTDGVFAFMVTGAALLAFKAWMTGRGWTWFWLMTAAATLTKGPLGLVLPAGGLLACVWEKKIGRCFADPRRVSERGSLVYFDNCRMVAGFLLAIRYAGVEKIAIKGVRGASCGYDGKTRPRHFNLPAAFVLSGARCSLEFARLLGTLADLAAPLRRNQRATVRALSLLLVCRRSGAFQHRSTSESGPSLADNARRGLDCWGGIGAVDAILFSQGGLSL
jgi:hypothetical protein